MSGAFSAFWTAISFVLTGPPFRYSQLGAGLFAFVGAGGVLIAPLAGLALIPDSITGLLACLWPAASRVTRAPHWRVL